MPGGLLLDVRVLLLALLAAGGAGPGPDAARAENASSLAGRLLVASPAMGDPNFAETVIYMLEHSERGAMGLVINRPLGRAPLGRLLEELGQEAPTTDRPIRVYSGGPVERARGFVLHSPDVLLEDSSKLAPDLAVTGSAEMLRALAEGRGPRRAIFLFGYAGWGPGQLDAEIAAGAWESVELDAALVFEEPDGSRWESARASRGIEL